MGKNNGLYKAEFPIGTTVRIKSRNDLEHFKNAWKHHHPIQDAKLSFADMEAIIEDVSFYHGGDELYSLKGISGLWHKACLEACKEKIR